MHHFRKQKVTDKYVNNIQQEKLQDHHVIVSLGPHQKGSPITAKEKRCILNLYQSFIDDDNMSPKEAKGFLWISK